MVRMYFLTRVTFPSYQESEPGRKTDADEKTDLGNYIIWIKFKFPGRIENNKEEAKKSLHLCNWEFVSLFDVSLSFFFLDVQLTKRKKKKLLGNTNTFRCHIVQFLFPLNCEPVSRRVNDENESQKSSTQNKNTTIIINTPENRATKREEKTKQQQQQQQISTRIQWTKDYTHQKSHSFSILYWYIWVYRTLALKIFSIMILLLFSLVIAPNKFQPIHTHKHANTYMHFYLCTKA